MRIAMWSGPRNLSTALMYAFAARGDCAVWDEPFYAAYLAESGTDHPLREATLAARDADPARVAAACAGPIPGGAPLFYQKHMTHHMCASFPLDWMASVTNVFLIRHPARVVASYVKKRKEPHFDDLGFAEQHRLYDYASSLGARPTVVDSVAVRADPKGMLERLCGVLDIPWTDRMLAWPAGGHPADGPWAPHWYGAVHRSTGFAGPEPSLPEIPSQYQALVDRALPYYDMLAEQAL